MWPDLRLRRSRWALALLLLVWLAVACTSEPTGSGDDRAVAAEPADVASSAGAGSLSTVQTPPTTSPPAGEAASTVADLNADWTVRHATSSGALCVAVESALEVAFDVSVEYYSPDSGDLGYIEWHDDTLRPVRTCIFEDIPLDGLPSRSTLVVSMVNASLSTGEASGVLTDRFRGGEFEEVTIGGVESLVFHSGSYQGSWVFFVPLARSYVDGIRFDPPSGADFTEPESELTDRYERMLALELIDRYG